MTWQWETISLGLRFVCAVPEHSLLPGWFWGSEGGRSTGSRWCEWHIAAEAPLVSHTVRSYHGQSKAAQNRETPVRVQSETQTDVNIINSLKFPFSRHTFEFRFLWGHHVLWHLTTGISPVHLWVTNSLQAKSRYYVQPHMYFKLYCTCEATTWISPRGQWCPNRIKRCFKYILAQCLLGSDCGSQVAWNKHTHTHTHPLRTNQNVNGIMTLKERESLTFQSCWKNWKIGLLVWRRSLPLRIPAVCR